MGRKIFALTLLITHYNRSNSLERLLLAFQKLDCQFVEIIVADDASKPEHLNRLKDIQPIYNFRLLPPEPNGGLGRNLNKGHDAVKTPYMLYVQEDFDPTELLPQHLMDAVQIMDETKDVDYIRFWSFYRFPTLKPFGKGFSETVFNPWNLNHLNYFMYSDNPHIRRTGFLEKFGRYDEGVPSDIAEHNMSIRFIQRKGRGLFYEEHSTLFEHRNSSDEPSTVTRGNWRQSSNPVFLLMRAAYLKYKCVKCFWQVKFLK